MTQNSTPTVERRWDSEKQRWVYPVVHHIDGNPRNNDLANLRFVWPEDNQCKDRK